MMSDSARFWLRFLLLPATVGVVLIIGFAFGVWIIVAIAFVALMMIGVVWQWCAAWMRDIREKVSRLREGSVWRRKRS